KDSTGQTVQITPVFSRLALCGGGRARHGAVRRDVIGGGGSAPRDPPSATAGSRPGSAKRTRPTHAYKISIGSDHCISVMVDLPSECVDHVRRARHLYC